MKKLITTLSILIFIVVGYLMSQHIFSIFVGGEGLFIWLTMLCATIWFGRRNKDGMYMLLKDTHQSNLDDIQRQELEEQEVEVIK